MSGFTYEADFLGTLAQILTDLQGYTTFAYEMVQNADDAEAHGDLPAATSIRFDVRDDLVEVSNDGVFSFCGDHTRQCSQTPPCNVHAFLRVAAESKRQRDGTTGAFGIGFVSSYQITDHPELISAGLHLTLMPEASELRDMVVACDGCEHCREQTGTVFRLPWATPGSDLRRRLGQEARHSPDELADELRGCLRDALPFLQRLVQIELLRNRNSLAVFGCERTDTTVTLTGPGNEVRQLYRFSGDFDDAATELRDREDSPIEPKRQSRVEVLVSERLDSGRIYATLPTDELLPATVLASADFFPRSDRRSITLEAGTRGDWNRVAIDAIGRVIADNLSELPERIGHQATWRLIRSVHQTATEVRDQAFRPLWETLLPSLDRAAITPTATGGAVVAKAALFVPAPEDDVSAGILHTLGANAVSPAIREFVQHLPRSAFGMRDLSATTLAALIDASSVEDLAPEELQDLWSLMDRILGRDRGSSRAAHSEEVFGRTTTAPEVDGSLAAWNTIKRADPATTKLLARYEYLLDTKRLGPHGNLSDQLTSRLKVDGNLLGAMRDIGVGGTELPIAEWLYARRDEWKEEPALAEAIAKLPVFPTRAAEGLRFVPLVELAFPHSRTGDFVDDAGIARVLDTGASAEVVALAKLLGIDELTLDVYINDHLATALASEHAEQQAPSWITDLLATLARQTAEIIDSTELTTALESLPFVPCGTRCVMPREAIFSSESTVVALGADWPTYDGPVAAHGLLAALGVSSSPQPAHIIARIEDLTANPPTPESVAAIRALLRLMASRYSFQGQGQTAALSEAVEMDYAELLESEWLPAEGDNAEWWSPSSLYLHTRAVLFESQGRFLDMTVTEENAIIDFLRAIGIDYNPPLKLVIGHLRHCHDTGTKPNSQVYTELSNKADELSDEDITSLCEYPSLWLADGRWASTDEVFWDEPGIGEFAKRLDPVAWGPLRPLLDKLGVREHPDGTDAIRVLKEIASHDHMEWGSLDAIATRCWQILSEAVTKDEIQTEVVRSRLGDRRCVIAGHELLRPPEVYVDDRPQLTKSLQDKLGHTLITRPEATWSALKAAGVRAISELLVPRPSYETTRPHNMLKRVFGERRHQIARVLESAFGSSVGREALARILELEIVAAPGLSVRWKFAPDGTFPVTSNDASAIWVPLEGRLYVAPGRLGNDLVREIAFALDADPTRLYVLKEVLTSEDADDAEKILDDLSIPRIGETVAAQASQTVGLSENAVEDVAEEGDWTDDEQPDSEPDDNGYQEPDADSHDHTSEAADEDDETSDGEVHSEHSGHAGSASSNDQSTPHRTRSGGSGSGWSDSGSTTNNGRSTRESTRAEGRQRDPADAWHVFVSGRASRGDEDEPGPGTPQHARKLAIDAAGMAAVREYERNADRDPDTVKLAHENPGYDILSLDADGNIDRYIEVKSLAGDWGEGRSFPRITSRQLEFAQGRHVDADGNHVDPETVWLYVVERAETEPRITPINNPMGHATRFVFDRGWRALGEITIDDGDIEDIAEIVRTSGLTTPVARYVPGDDPDVLFDLAWPAQHVAIVSAEYDCELPDDWHLLTLGSFDLDELLDVLQASTDVADAHRSA